MRLLFLILLFVTSSCMLNAQQTDTLAYPEVGKPMPDFVLKNIAHYSKKQANLQDFKGKWLMLDFWNKGCGACIVSFPTTSAIQKNLGEKVQVMLVGIQDPEGQIQPLFEKYRKKLDLLMPCAFDSDIAKRFDIYTAPHIVLVDEQGIVRCVTIAMNTNDLMGFLAGTPPDLPQTYRRMHDDNAIDEIIPFDDRKPFLVDGNGGRDSDFLCRSVLSRWDRNKHTMYNPTRIPRHSKGKFEILGTSLTNLYRYAYFGAERWGPGDTSLYAHYSGNLILQVEDSTPFKMDYKYNKNIFSYSLILPESNDSKQSIEMAMQKDLEIYFGYQAEFEWRKTSYWRLEATANARERLKTKGGGASFTKLVSGFKVKNWPIWQVLDVLYFGNEDRPVIDETGIVGNIDISLDFIATDFEDLQRALVKNGLRLVPAKKDMMALVIRDRRLSNATVSLQ